MSHYKARNRRIDTGKRDRLGRPIYNWEPVKDVDHIIEDLSIMFPGQMEQENPSITVKNYDLEKPHDLDNVILVDAELQANYMEAKEFYDRSIRLLNKYLDEPNIDNDNMLNHIGKYSDVRGNKPFGSVTSGRYVDYWYDLVGGDSYSNRYSIARRHMNNIENKQCLGIQVPSELTGKLRDFNKQFSMFKNYAGVQKEYEQFIGQVRKIAKYYNENDDSKKKEAIIKVLDMAIDQAQEDIRTKVYDEDYARLLEQSKINNTPVFLEDKTFRYNDRDGNSRYTMDGQYRLDWQEENLFGVADRVAPIRTYLKSLASLEEGTFTPLTRKDEESYEKFKNSNKIFKAFSKNHQIEILSDNENTINENIKKAYEEVRKSNTPELWEKYEAITSLAKQYANQEKLGFYTETQKFYDIKMKCDQLLEYNRIQSELQNGKAPENIDDIFKL